MTLLNVCGLSHHYAHGGFSGKHQHQAVLNNVSLTLKSGETVALLGRSGCGKSTLLRQLKTVLAPHGTRVGEILFEGTPLDELDQRTQSQKIGFVQQSPDNQIVTVKRSAAIFRWYFRTPSAP